MKIMLGSKNPSKYKSVELALKSLGISDYEIFDYSVSSGVHSRPIGYEIIRGADNRNQELKNIAFENGIDYDYLCSIEGGYSTDETGLPFVVTYCVIEDKKGRKSTGKSLGLRLTRTVFDYIRDGNSINDIIRKVTNESVDKKNGGVMGYLTNGLLNRDEVDKDAVISSFISFLYEEPKQLLDDEIKKISKDRVD